jgi:hypothetical protein
MKKIILSLILITILGMTIVPSISLAQDIMDGCDLRHDVSFDGTEYFEGDSIGSDNTAWGMICLFDTIYTVTDWIFYILLAVTGVLVVWGGTTIAMAGGDAENMQKGKNYIMYAMMGLAVALLSRAIPAIVQNVLGA